MLESGVIRDSASPYSSSVVLVKKKDDTWRICSDHKALYQVTTKDRYLIYLIEELLDELGGAVIFPKIDLRSEHWQIRRYPSSIEKTTSKTHESHYEFLVILFGPTDTPSTFQNIMNCIFKPFLWKFVIVFFDDILIYNKRRSDHLLHLEIVLQLLELNQLYAKRTKCIFGVAQVDYLGYIISAKRVTTDPKKIQATIDWPVLKTLR